MSFEKLIGQI